jgi:hypothetical protein
MPQSSELQHGRSEIILIGPTKAGKSTLAVLLSQRLNQPHRSLDEERWRYMREIGYDEALAQAFRATGGFLAKALYWQLFNAYVVERFLAEHEHCVMHFGAGHSVCDSTEMLGRIERALAPYPNIVLILPSPDPDESIRVLNERLAAEEVHLNFDFSAHFVRHPSNYRLARHVVYTERKMPEETADEILAVVGLRR